MILIGYSGHSYVINGIFSAMGQKVTGYCDKSEKQYNPLGLIYLGSEISDTGLEALAINNFFVAVGDNQTRERISSVLGERSFFPCNAIHPSSVIDNGATIAPRGVMISSHVAINAFAKIGNGVICNTHSVIEHQCNIGDFAHIGPGAILCGNVHVGQNTLIGAGAVVRENIRIGKNVTVGAGSVVINDIKDNQRVAGNPAFTINRNLINPISKC